jgi:hypothetical protein
MIVGVFELLESALPIKQTTYPLLLPHLDAAFPGANQGGPQNLLPISCLLARKREVESG